MAARQECLRHQAAPRAAEPLQCRGDATADSPDVVSSWPPRATDIARAADSRDSLGSWRRRALAACHPLRGALRSHAGSCLLGSAAYHPLEEQNRSRRTARLSRASQPQGKHSRKGKPRLQTPLPWREQTRWCAWGSAPIDAPVPGRCVPDPLRDDLPGGLPSSRVRTPAVGVLFLVFIGQGGGVSPTMQIEGDDIGRGESALGQSSEEFVDQARAGEADAALLSGGRMSRHHHAAPLSRWPHRHIRAIVEGAYQLTFRAAELLIGRQVQAALHLCAIEHGVVTASASHSRGPPTRQGRLPCHIAHPTAARLAPRAASWALL